MVPAKVEQGKLFLLNRGESFFEEIILSDKKIIEETIKQVSNVDIIIKGFVGEESISQDEERDLQNEEGRELSDEEYRQKVIEFFGKENVTFTDN